MALASSSIRLQAAESLTKGCRPALALSASKFLQGSIPRLAVPRACSPIHLIESVEDFPVRRLRPGHGVEGFRAVGRPGRAPSVVNRLDRGKAAAGTMSARAARNPGTILFVSTSGFHGALHLNPRRPQHFG